ncbi:MAG: sulfite exporter TauE/SafE family protein [Deltaproteobacteria bacterium]|nr:sulfite exporter TauE/SafE family protein [Deltaproteobacteria bacterium]
MELDQALIVVVGSFAVGVLGGLLGVGGGVFLVPFLVMFDVATPKMAVAISLCCVICTSAAAALVSGRNLANQPGTARLSTALRLEPALVTGAVVASLFGVRVGDGALLIGFGLLILFIALLIRVRSRFAAPDDAPWSSRRMAFVVALAFLSGAASGLFGVGGGVLVVPTLVLVGRWPLKAAAATSSLCLMTSAAAGAAVHHAYAPLPVDVVAAVIVGVLPGGFAGARLQRVASDTVLEAVFIALAVVVAGLSIWRGLQ